MGVWANLQLTCHKAPVTHIAWACIDRVLLTGDSDGVVYATLLPSAPHPLLSTAVPDKLDLSPAAFSDLASATAGVAAAHAGSAVTSLEVQSGGPAACLRLHGPVSQFSLRCCSYRAPPWTQAWSAW